MFAKRNTGMSRERVKCKITAAGQNPAALSVWGGSRLPAAEGRKEVLKGSPGATEQRALDMKEEAGLFPETQWTGCPANHPADNNLECWRSLEHIVLSAFTNWQKVKNTQVRYEVRQEPREVSRVLKQALASRCLQNLVPWSIAF